MSEIGWMVLTVVVLVLLVPVALFLGRALWTRIEPGDSDPGGRALPRPYWDSNVWTGTSFVDVLREARRLKQEQRDRQKNEAS